MANKNSNIKTQNIKNMNSANKMIKTLADNLKKQRKLLNMIDQAHFNQEAFKFLLTHNTFKYTLSAWTNKTNLSDEINISWSNINYFVKHQYLLISKTMKGNHNYYVVIKITKDFKSLLKNYLRYNTNDVRADLKKQDKYKNTALIEIESGYRSNLKKLNKSWKLVLKMYTHRGVLTELIAKLNNYKHLHDKISTLKQLNYKLGKGDLKKYLYCLCVCGHTIFKLDHLVMDCIMINDLDVFHEGFINDDEDFIIGHTCFADLRALILTGLVRVSEPIETNDDDTFFYIYPTSACEALVKKVWYPRFPANEYHPYYNAAELTQAIHKLHLGSINTKELMQIVSW